MAIISEVYFKLLKTSDVQDYGLISIHDAMAREYSYAEYCVIIFVHYILYD